MPANQGYMPLLRSFVAFFCGSSTDMSRLRRCGSDFVFREFFNRLLGDFGCIWKRPNVTSEGDEADAINDDTDNLCNVVKRKQTTANADCEEWKGKRKMKSKEKRD